MKVSEERQTAAYRAISDPIIEMRLKWYRENRFNKKELDEELFDLERTIWDGICQALNIEAGQ